MASPGPAPRLGPRGHVEVKRTRKSTASTATLEPLDKGLALHSSASAELPTLRRQKGASTVSTVSLHREKVYEECSIEIQDSRNLPNSVPGNVNGKAPIQTAKRSRSESRSDLQRQMSGASLEPQWIKDKKPLSRDWRVAAARAVEDRALRQRKQVSISLSQGELEVKEQDGRALPRQGTAAFQAPQRELTAYEKVCFENRLLPKFMTKVKDAVSGPVLDLCSCGLGDDQLVAVFAWGP
ncbi:unnamed protein product [Cladocopium goreaui]|uniref:Protein NLRC3 n=1 Tax=Cladocopium goreaui TaxID=2562237 RepID=A0A9P1BHH2_9DINO|nr:unnamed protein product [Cladocopium goreaui]